MTKSKLFEMKPDFFDAAQDGAAEVLLARLEIVKQRLLVLLGAVLMFDFLSLLNPETWEYGPLPFIWGAFIIFPIGLGIYLLASPKWRIISLRDRRVCAIGSFAISLLAVGFLPILLIIYGDFEAVPYTIFVFIIGLILYAVYRKLGLHTTVSLDDDMFP